MPVNRRFDFTLGDHGFMMPRKPPGGRAWHRTGLPDTPSRRSDEASKYGVLPPEVDFPEVWDDWSGGFGHAYRRTGENTYHWAENMDLRFPRQAIHAQAPRIGASYIASLEKVNWVVDAPILFTSPKEGAGNVAMLGAGRFAVLNPTETGLDLTHDASAIHNFRFRPAIFGSYMYVGSDIGSFCYQMNSIALASTISAPGYSFVNAGNQLWRAHGPAPGKGAYLQNVANPAGVMTLANWSATYNVGNYMEAVRDLAALEDQVFVGMASGVYAGDQSGTFVNILPDIAGQSHVDNCRDLAVWENSMAVQHIAGIFRYIPGGALGNAEDISPPRTDRSPVKGRVRALRGYGRYLYAGLYTGSQSWLLSGERQQRGVVWHTLQRFPHQAKISRIHVDGISVASSGNPIPNRIWASMDYSIDTNGTAPLYFWPIPVLDGNPLAGGGAFSANYVGSARLDLGNVDFGAPGTPKVYREVEVWADMLLSGYRYADVYYDVDQSGSFTLLGRAQTSPKSALYFTTNPFITGQSVELSLRSFTASPAYTPIYRAIVLRGAERPRSVDTITAMVRIADNIRDRQGGTMRSGASMLQELRDMTATSSPVRLIDLAGATSYVSVLPPVEEQEVWQQGDEAPEVAATVRLAVLTFS